MPEGEGPFDGEGPLATGAGVPAVVQAPATTRIPTIARTERADANIDQSDAVFEPRLVALPCAPIDAASRMAAIAARTDRHMLNALDVPRADDPSSPVKSEMTPVLDAP